MSGDWLAEGKRVAIISRGGVGRDRVEYRMVERLTKTQAVLVGGMRFNRSTLREVGRADRSAWSASWVIAAEDDPRVAPIQAAQRKAGCESRAWSTLEDAQVALRRDDYALAKTKALAAIDQLDLLLGGAA